MNYTSVSFSLPQTDLRAHRRRAAAILSIPGMRLRIVCGTLLFITFWIGGLYMSENVWYALDWGGLYETSPFLYDFADVLFYVTDALFILFAGLPLLYGYARLMLSSAAGALPPLSTLFCAFGNRACYWRSIAITLRLLLRYAIWLGGTALLIFLAMRTRGALSVLLAVIAGIYPVIGSIGMCLGDAVLVLDLLHPEYSVSELFRRSSSALKESYTRLWLYKLRLLPWWIAGLLTFCTLLLFHSLPYCIFTAQYAVWYQISEQPPSALSEETIQ